MIIVAEEKSMDRGLASRNSVTWTQIPALGWADRAGNVLWENTLGRKPVQGRQEPAFPRQLKWGHGQELWLIDLQVAGTGNRNFAPLLHGNDAGLSLAVRNPTAKITVA